MNDGVRVISIFLLLNHIVTGTHQQNNHNVMKRMDIETCIGQFDVQNDMIIRTEESRKLGGKFLDNADGGSREECLRFCCETNQCDVFVHDECNLQSESCSRTCFLFHCGPAQNFRCKFTKHANYTSAVLTKKLIPSTVPPRAALSQHEMELKNLKSKLGSANVSPSGVAGAADAIVATVPTASPIVMPAKNSSNVCSRFQFQCHSGECIAVYNACDSIPQCEDGSDEGPECQLGARASDPSTNKVVEGRVKLYSTNNQKEAPLSPVGFVSHNREDPMTAPQWPVINQSPVVPHSNDMSGHIFNHKGGLHIPNPITQQQQLPIQPPAFQLPYNLQPQQGQLPAMDNTRPMWQQMPQFPMKPIEQLAPGVQQNGPYFWPILSPNLPIYSVNTNNNEETLPKQDVVQAFEDTAVADKKKNGKSLISNKSGAASTSTEEKDSEYDNEEEEQPTEPPPTKKVHKHKKVLKTPSSDAVAAPEQATDDKKNSEKVEDSAPQQLKMMHSKLQMEFLDHDGDSEKPSGAVLSLTLGIIITILMIALVGCRATVVRKRIRRGGKAPYSHDADFLVNGLYL